MDPPVLAREEYPEWLWSLADERKPLITLQREFQADELTDDAERRRFVKLSQKDIIKDNNKAGTAF